MEKDYKFYITVVIPALNEEKYLPNLLDDLSKQTFKNFEVIVVDGRSDDKTVAKTLAYKTKLPALNVIVSKKRNVSFQRNLGEKNANGKWIIFMDADNRIPSYFLDGVKYKTELKKTDLFTCWCEVDARTSSEKAIARYINIGVEIAKLLDRPLAQGSMIGITKKAFEKTGGFDVKTIFLEDGKFVMGAFKKGLKFTIFKDPRYVHSLRRFRRTGMLRTLQEYVKLYFKKLSRLQIDQSEYPMGGDVVGKIEEPVFKTIQDELKHLVRKPKLIKRIQAVLDKLESDF